MTTTPPTHRLVAAWDPEPVNGSVVQTRDGEVWNRDDDWPTRNGDGPWYRAASYEAFLASGGIAGRTWETVIGGDVALVIRDGWAS